MTLEAAQKLVYRELGIWTEEEPCRHGFFNGHVISDPRYGNGVSTCTTCWCRNVDRCTHTEPMPPLDDGLLAVILRRTGMSVQPYDYDTVTDQPVTWMAWYGHGKVTYTDDPVIAAVMAFAQYLQNKEKGA